MTIFCMFPEREGNEGNSKCDDQISINFSKIPKCVRRLFLIFESDVYIFQHSKIFQLRTICMFMCSNKSENQ